MHQLRSVHENLENILHKRLQSLNISCSPTISVTKLESVKDVNKWVSDMVLTRPSQLIFCLNLAKCDHFDTIYYFSRTYCHYFHISYTSTIKSHKNIFIHFNPQNGSKESKQPCSHSTLQFYNCSHLRLAVVTVYASTH